MKIEYKSTIKSTKVALQNSKLRFHLIKILSLSVTHVVFFFFFFLGCPSNYVYTHSTNKILYFLNKNVL